ncbi:MAG: flavin reductase family protein [Lachnospiraceae bacterium]|nr:flavin reductase family protein [Lachnospiraceae bacterium]
MNKAHPGKKHPFRPGNLLYPLPAVMVSCGDMENSNIITVAWTGTICSDPAMVSISVRPERYSYGIIRDSGEFVINLTTERLARATDLCGVKSGRDHDKFQLTGLTKAEGFRVRCPLIAESPVNIECRVKEILPLGSHDMFLAEVLCLDVSESVIDVGGKFRLNEQGLLVYSHGEYYSLGKKLGKFGYSVQKNNFKDNRSQKHSVSGKPAILPPRTQQKKFKNQKKKTKGTSKYSKAKGF